jgi:hypothetical protein
MQIAIVIPGRNEVASQESISTGRGYRFRARVSRAKLILPVNSGLKTRQGMTTGMRLQREPFPMLREGT